MIILFWLEKTHALGGPVVKEFLNYIEKFASLLAFFLAITLKKKRTIAMTIYYVDKLYSGLLCVQQIVMMSCISIYIFLQGFVKFLNSLLVNCFLKMPQIVTKFGYVSIVGNINSCVRNNHCTIPRIYKDIIKNLNILSFRFSLKCLAASRNLDILVTYAGLLYHSKKIFRYFKISSFSFLCKFQEIFRYFEYFSFFFFFLLP